MFDPRREFIFGDIRPFAQCHASSLVETRANGIFAAWFGGSREGRSDVGIWAAARPAFDPETEARAPDEKWSSPRCIAKVSDEPHWNPVLYALPQPGESTTEPELVLQFKVGARIRSWITWIQRSSDAGKTWSEARPLGPTDRGGRGPVRTKPIRLSSGDWLAGASTETWRRWDAFLDRSPNGIDGWQATEDVLIDRSAFAGKGLIQPALWESSPGRVHALFRSTAGEIYRSDSEDDGRTFSAAYPTGLPNNNSGLDLARLPGGGLALVCNPIAGNWAERTPLSILFSWDNGATWPAQIDLETEPGEYSYPALITAGPRGSDLALTYTWNRRRIAYIRIPADALPSCPTP